MLTLHAPAYDIQEERGNIFEKKKRGGKKKRDRGEGIRRSQGKGSKRVLHSETHG